MAYTLQGIRERVLEDKLDDPTFDPDIVDRFINDAQKSIFNSYELPFQEKRFSSTLSATEDSFDMPEDLQMELGLVLTAPTDSIYSVTDDYIPFRQFNRMYPYPPSYEAGSPSIWTKFGAKVQFSRPMDLDYTVDFFYLKRPDPLEEDEDVPEIPEEFEELLVLGAYYRILERNEDYDLAAFYKNGDYADEIDKLVARYGKRQRGSATVMSQPLRTSRARSSGRR